MTGAAKTVRAAGGAIWRRTGDGEVEVVLVHRPRYDDWSLPKGKADPGETDEDAAVREVEEETGIIATLGAELAHVEYVDRNGRAKTVRYWAMTVDAVRSRQADDEVDVVAWARLDEARARLTYGRDQVVLDGLAEMLGD